MTDKISEEKLAQLKTAFGRIEYTRYNGTDLVFRQPKRSEVQEHAVKDESGPAQKAVADVQLAQQIIIYCGGGEGLQARENFLAFLDLYPYCYRSLKIGRAISRLTGIVEEESEKE